MPKAEGYTYEESGVKKNIYYSKMFAPGDNNVLTDYRVKGDQIRGDRYLANTGMTRAASEGRYTGNSSNGISDLAREGTAVLGGNPNIKYTRDDDTVSEKITLSLNTNNTLVVTDGVGLIRKTYSYSAGVDFIKVWIAATGGGGGAGGHNGGGGAGGGFAIFPAIVERGGNLVISCGTNGHGGDDTNDYQGKTGGLTRVTANLPSGSEYTIAYLRGGSGGIGNYFSETPAVGGSVLLYSDSAHPDYPNIPTNWLTYLGATSVDMLYTKIDGKVIEGLSDWYINKTLIYASTGGNGGKSTKYGDRGSSRLIGAANPLRKRDYYYPYFQSTWGNSGGNSYYNSTHDWNSSGGGASTFYGSYGANGNEGASSGERNGYLGGGGSSGDSRSGGGWGGFGAADIWIAGVTDSSIVSIGTRNSTWG